MALSLCNSTMESDRCCLVLKLCKFVWAHNYHWFMFAIGRSIDPLVLLVRVLYVTWVCTTLHGVLVHLTRVSSSWGIYLNPRMSSNKSRDCITGRIHLCYSNYGGSYTPVTHWPIATRTRPTNTKRPDRGLIVKSAHLRQWTRIKLLA